MAKYTTNQICKTLDKVFKAGFNTEKAITSMRLEDLEKIPNLIHSEMNIIISLKKAIKSKNIICFLNGIDI